MTKYKNKIYKKLSKNNTLFFIILLLFYFRLTSIQ